PAIAPRSANASHPSALASRSTSPRRTTTSPATAPATSGTSAVSTSRYDGVAPSAGTAASSGNAGRLPTSTPVGAIVVPVPSWNPAPAMNETTYSPTFGSSIRQIANTTTEPITPASSSSSIPVTREKWIASRTAYSSEAIATIVSTAADAAGTTSRKPA